MFVAVVLHGDLDLLNIGLGVIDYYRLLLIVDQVSEDMLAINFE